MRKDISQTLNPRFVRRLLRRSALCAALLPLLLSTMACDDEDEESRYPSVKLEFFTMQSDAGGRPLTILTDDGVRRPVLEYSSAKLADKDTELRAVGHYEEANSTGTAGVRLYTWSAVVAPLPRVEADFKEGVKRDPADLQSAWMGWDYLNMLLAVKGQDKKHTFHFVEESVTLDPVMGVRSVTLSLYHDAAGDVQAYTRRAYLSVPLRQYAADGVRKVEITFKLRTYAGEWKVRSFDYLPR